MGPILFGAQHERRERGWWKKRVRLQCYILLL
jgi:hypothetical protein